MAGRDNENEMQSSAHDSNNINEIPIMETYGKCTTCGKQGWIKIFSNYNLHEICRHKDNWGDMVTIVKPPVAKKKPLLLNLNSNPNTNLKIKAKSIGSSFSRPTTAIPLRKSIQLRNRQANISDKTPEIVEAYNKLLEENRLLSELVKKAEKEKEEKEKVAVVEEKAVGKEEEQDHDAKSTVHDDEHLICSSIYDCQELATISNSDGFWFCEKHFKLLSTVRKHCNLFDACDGTDLVEISKGLFGCSAHRSQYGLI